MSYQVLARKWRSRTFAELVGQDHVRRALVNALDNDRLHHAFLFTGTRGVGKTTIARILAKSLNCEAGVSSQPCGTCDACREIDEGRFVDLIEVDAASRTKVEDTRELLDNVQYAPTRGRYKVYLVDEVHMLSNHSFNALLKTLEEPPPHVKFLLATTDPQKLPVTILSRCLQFNLRRLTAEQIRAHLAHILGAEGVDGEEAALARLARAADGSMRDALSLLDQAIAFGGGAVRDEDVRAMLGTIEHTHVTALLEALAGGDAGAVLQQVAELDRQAPDYAGVLAELLSALHRIAVLQAVPDGEAPQDLPEDERLRALAARLAPEDVQLFYQIGLIGRRDLSLAPEPRGGFEMVLLRMLAFRPADAEPVQSAAPAAPQPDVPRESPAPAARAQPGPIADWHATVERLGLVGVLRELALHSAIVGQSEQGLELALEPACGQLLTREREQKLQEVLAAHLGREVRLRISVQGTDAETPAARAARERDERQRAAAERIENDANVKALQERFNARVQPDSIRPRD